MQQGAGSAAYSASPGDLAGRRGSLLRPARRIEILAHLSGAFDIAEQQQTGHAARVAYLSFEIGHRLGFGGEESRRLLAAGLLHDAGVPVRHEGGHLAAGAWVAGRFGFDESVGAAILATHERWDGRGRPDGLRGSEIAIEGLVVAAAHWACEFADGSMSPLRARAQLQNSTIEDIEPLAGRVVAAALRDALRQDQTWLAMWNDDLPRLVAQVSAGEGRPAQARVEQAARAMGDVVDAAVREPGRAGRVSALARQIASILGLPEAYCDAIAVAGHLLDIGQLGVPKHITDKPSILTVDEMELMRSHPVVGARLLDRAPGLSEVAEWVAMHHERPDGRGYPELLGAEELPVAPRILAVADAYWALRAERPYRPAFSEDEAMVMIELGAGRQFDPAAVEVLPEAIEALVAATAGADAAG